MLAVAPESLNPLSASVAAQSAPVGTSERVAGRPLVLSDSVAVVPFANVSRDAADEWIGDGIAETIIADLETLGGLSVIARTRVQAALPARPEATLDDDLATTLGRRLDARWVITGGYQRLGDQVRITARLIDTRESNIARTVKLDGGFEEIFDLQDRIVGQLVSIDVVRSNPGASAPRPARVARRTDDALVAVGGSGVGSEGGGSDGPGDMRPPGDQTFSPEEVTGGIILPDGAGAEVRRRGGRRSGSGAPGGVRAGGGPPPVGRGTGALGIGGPGTGPAGASPPGLGVEAPSGGPLAGVGILAGRPRITASRATESPRIDGRLDDAVWQRATHVTEFVQQSPLEGAPATEDTDVYIAFDDTHLYFGMHAHYSDPGLVRASRVDRDQAGRGDDMISFYFDTFLDQQRAYVFSLNGYGVQGDSLLEARGGGGGGGGGRGGFSGGGGRGSFTGVPRGDRSWDALFESGGTLVDDGWTAELAIPFKSLRYPAVGDRAHRWGFQISRRIRGKDETDVWAPISRDVSGFLPQMGLLDGLSGLSTSRNLEILPTMTAVQVGSLDRTNGGFPKVSQPEGGVNVKYGLTSNLTLDATFNPDFSQIESDRPQIEVNQRFPLFFSEQRPFFLEGQEIFALPGPVNFVHTRTIVDPRYGGKVTGKVGKTTLGVLVANDEAPGNLDDVSDPAFGQTANVLIGRVRYDLYSESHIGAIVTDREFLDNYSRLAGVDGNFRLSDTASIGFRAISTQNRNQVDAGGDFLDTSGNMLDVGMRSQGRNLNYFVAGYQIDPEFNTAVGFVRRRDIRAVVSNVGYRWWPESWLINWGPTASYGRNWDFEDILEDETAQAGVNFSFAKNIRFGTSVNRDMERFGGINFDKTTYSTNLFVNTLRSVSVGGYFRYGDQINYSATPFLGRGGGGGVFLTVRPFSRLQSQININTSNLIDPFDETEVFDVKIYRALTTYQFTDRLLLRNILEYNTFSGTVSANVLFTYRVNSGTVFFIGYDDRYQQGSLILDSARDPAYLGNQDFYTTDFMRTNRAFFTKISYLFRY